MSLTELRQHAVAWDRRAYTILSRRQEGWVDHRLFPALSDAGRGSRVWFALAGMVALAGGRRGRKAAVETLAAVGVASLIANVAVKLVVRRRRPVSQLPLLVRRPRSGSFPSGHAATSFAGATVLAVRFPGAGPAVLTLAAGIAASRVAVGVHYPIDVVAGAAVGVGVAGGVLAASRALVPPGTEPGDACDDGRA